MTDIPPTSDNTGQQDHIHNSAALCCRERPEGGLAGPCTWPDTDCYQNGLPAAGTTLRVHFSDACTDVLVWLADQPRGNASTIAGIDAGIAPPDADRARQTISSSLRTLYGCGLVEHVSVEGIGAWRATDAGRKAVADARAND